MDESDLSTLFASFKLELESDLDKYKVDKFNDWEEYVKIMLMRIQLEEDEQQKLYEGKRLDINLKSWKEEKDAVYANFCLDQGKVKDREMVTLKHNQEEFTETGIIEAIGKDYAVVLRKRIKYPAKELNNYKLEVVFNDTHFQRQRKAVCNLMLTAKEDSMQKMLLGINVNLSPEFHVPKLVSSAPGFPFLNPRQKQAIRHSLGYRFTLVQGPPGTGKTVTSVNIAYNLWKETGSTVLICAPSNIAVDNLMEKLMEIKEDLNIVRVNPQGLEFGHQNGRLAGWSLQRLVLQSLPGLKELQSCNLHIQEYLRLKKLKKVTENYIIGRADFILCTCSVTGDERLVCQKFKSCVINECGQSVESDTIIPIGLTSDRVVLVGDQNQLAPTVCSQDALKAGMGVSLFQRFINVGFPVTQLNMQYRMHPAISAFPSNEFYAGNIKDGVTAEEREFPVYFPWKRDSFPIIFYDVREGREEREGNSFRNRHEAEVAKDTVDLLIGRGMNPKDIGVITFYDGQKSYLKKMIGMSEDIDIATVDGFQGKEKEVIILSCVRTNVIGFLDDKKRLNVALTRARRGLIVIGNKNNLSKDVFWKKYLTYLREKDCIEEKTPIVPFSQNHD